MPFVFQVKKSLRQVSLAFSRNPLAWILFGLFAVAMYFNWSNSRDANRACEAFGEIQLSESPYRQKYIDFNNDQDLRFWRQRLTRVCRNRLAEP